jgi:peptide deformylase
MVHEHHHDHEHDHEHDHDHDHGHDEHDDDHGGHHQAEELAEAEAAAIRRHALAQIRQYPDVALKLKANEVTEFDDDLRRLVERMERLMHDAQGVGLAATQLGVLRRLFLFQPAEGTVHAVVNPRIVERSNETDVAEEGCLSLQSVRVPVERALTLTLEGKDPDGKDVRFELDGMGARVAQHENDHLDGLLIIDRTDDEHRREALGILRPQPVLR